MSSKGTGLIIGKFMPVHKGHQFLIETAIEQTDDLTILICRQADDPIPGELRMLWLKEMYPHIRILLTTTVEADPAKANPHSIEIIQSLLPHPIDYVFCSDNEGESWANVLGAKPICIDMYRTMVSISTQHIRHHPLGHWEYLPAPTRPYYVKRIAIVGANGSGKTTQANLLADYFNTVRVPEYADEFVKKYPEKKLQQDDISRIAEGQIAAENSFARFANRILFCDTELISITLKCHELSINCPDWVLEESCLRKYDLFLLMDNDLSETGDNHHAESYFNQLKEKLENQQAKYVVISGKSSHRLAHCITAVNQMLKQVFEAGRKKRV